MVASTSEGLFSANDLFLQGIYYYIMRTPIEILTKKIPVVFFINDTDDEKLSVKKEWIDLLRSKGTTCISIKKVEAEAILREFVMRAKEMEDEKEKLRKLCEKHPEINATILEAKREELAKNFCK